MKEKYLRPTPYCESDDEEIKRLAKRIVKGSKNQKQTTQKIFLWVRENIKWTPSKIVGAKKLLHRKPLIGLCTDKTNLFIALCRSTGLKSRYVIMDAKLQTIDKRLPPDTKHFAAEILINNKWVIMDPAFGKNTSKLMKVSEFGKPAWTSANNLKRMEGLSKPLVLLINLFIQYSPSGKKIRKIVEET